MFTPFSIYIPDRTLRVTDPPYGAVGDGKTECRVAIQSAIDDIAAQGGGRVVLPAPGTYLSAPLTIRSHVELCIEQGATLFQTDEPTEYVRPMPDGSYQSFTPVVGHNWSPTIKWSHTWYLNYPMIFALPGTHDFRVSGGGTMYMVPDTVPEDRFFRVCPIGFFRVSDFEILDVTITNYHGYAMMPFTSRNGLFKNLKINKSNHGNGDGICLMNDQNIRVTECDMSTGDDSVYIFSSYRDPRGITWWTSDYPQASVDIEVDHNHLVSDHCKAFGMILWGIDCPDLEQVEVRNVYVHDNYLKTMGNWLWCPYTDKVAPPPVTTVRFENNEIGAIEFNFFETQISNMNHFHSMTKTLNEHFKDGRVFWVTDANRHPRSSGVMRTDKTAYGYLDHLDCGPAALWQGIYVYGGGERLLSARVKTFGGATPRLFVRELDSGKTVAVSEPFSCENGPEDDGYTWVHLHFTVPASGNYALGVESGESKSGTVHVNFVKLAGNMDSAMDYKTVVNVDGNEKVLFFENTDDVYFERQ